MFDDGELLSMLRVVHEADEACEPIDSEAMARRLGWSDDRTATLLADARAALLIWGIRVSGMPPGFADLELTVQGRRLLRAAEASSDNPTRGE